MPDINKKLTGISTGLNLADLNPIGLVADDINEFGDLLTKDQKAVLVDRQIGMRAKAVEQNMEIMRERLNTYNMVRDMIKTGSPAKR